MTSQWASFPDHSHLQCLIACSMQTQRRKACQRYYCACSEVWCMYMHKSIGNSISRPHYARYLGLWMKYEAEICTIVVTSVITCLCWIHRVRIFELWVLWDMKLGLAPLWSAWMELSNDFHFAVGWILTQNHETMDLVKYDFWQKCDRH